jgi:hypothetical protein
MQGLVGQHRVIDKALHLGHGQGIGRNGRLDLPLDKGPQAAFSSSSALPTRSWLVMAM